MRVFVTGASGFIGRALCERYRADGHEVAGCDLEADASRGVVGGDVSEPGAWQRHATGCDLVIHTAAVVSFRLERPEEVWRANVLGTANAIAAAERAGARRFVHFSSVTVFGLDFPDGVDERYPVHNTYMPYPDTKIASEQLVLAGAPRRARAVHDRAAGGRVWAPVASLGSDPGGADQNPADDASRLRARHPLARVHRRSG